MTFDPLGEFRDAIANLRAGLNNVSGRARQHEQVIERVAAKSDELQRALSVATVGRGRSVCGPWRSGIKRIEDIPGRRVPFTLIIDITIASDSTSVQEASEMIPQEGPFVAVKRWATFQSALEFQVTDPVSGQRGTFVGRSFGRYRPVHSVCDVMDGQQPNADPGRWYLNFFQNPGAPVGDIMPSAALGLPSNMSGFRSMEFDGRITIINAGSSYPRSNKSVPSSFWAAEQNSPVALGALDFFERGELITGRVQPNHINNPDAGNVNGDFVFPERTAPTTGGWPFLDGQFDAHEGIATPQASTLGQITNPLRPSLLATDAITRLPQGVLTLAWDGYRIIQPPGMAI